MSNMLDVPKPPDFVRFRADFGRRFVLTVDTEEEFDWSKPFDRAGHDLNHLPRLGKFQQFCEGLGIVPVYLIDFPVANDARCAEILKGAVSAGRAEVGVQLHPWVSPPYSEEIGEHNSFAGNLPADLERAKFRKLRDTIEAAFGVPPRIYRAGRYGIGPATAGILAETGIAFDTSVRARFDYSGSGGPDFRRHPLKPYWIDRTAGLIELPLTTVFWGLLRQQGDALYPRLWRAPRLRGALARAGLLERIPLTPEGVSEDEAIRGIDIALDDGLDLLVFSFHSPSLLPGHTPYVRDEDDLDRFYDWWRTVFAYLAKRGVRAAKIGEVFDAVEI
jgi:hypothetical protein